MSLTLGFPGDSAVKNPPAMQDTRGRSLGWEDPLEKAMATHSSILPGRIPRTGEPGGLQSMGSQSDTTDRLTHMHRTVRSQSSDLALPYSMVW